jgi:hypothetical protein
VGGNETMLYGNETKSYGFTSFPYHFDSKWHGNELMLGGF